MIGEPDIGRDAVLVHRLFHPMEIELFQRSPKAERFLAGVFVVRIEHEPDVRADALADGLAGSDVAIEVGTVWRHPGVHLEGGISFCHAGGGEIGVRLGTVQPTRDVVATHGACVGGH